MDDKDEELERTIQKMFDDTWNDPEFWKRIERALFWEQEIRESFVKIQIPNEKTTS